MSKQEYQPIHDSRTEGEKSVYKALGPKVFDEIIYDCIDYALREVEYAKKLGISLDTDKLIGTYIWKRMGETNSQISSIEVRNKGVRRGKKPDFSGILKFLLTAEQKDLEIKRRYDIKAKNAEQNSEE
jgi:hypothetical protein